MKLLNSKIKITKEFSVLNKIGKQASTMPEFLPQNSECVFKNNYKKKLISNMYIIS